MRVRGLLVIGDENVGALQAEVDRLAQDGKLLEAEVAALRAAAPKVKVVRVDRLVTAPAPARGEEGECLLLGADVGQVRLTRLEFRTQLGNAAVVGVGQAWRLTPPERLLFEGPVSAELSNLVMLRDDDSVYEARRRRWWGVGGFAAATTGGGWVAGPAASATLWRVDATLGVGFGSGGAGASLTAVVH
jgi:hypothetical protein